MRKSSMFSSAAFVASMTLCASAQTSSVEDSVSYKIPVDCTKEDCHLSARQLSALAVALTLYREDMPKVKFFSAQVNKLDERIEISFFPENSDGVSWFAERGDQMSASYIFQPDGVTLYKRIFNR